MGKTGAHTAQQLVVCITIQPPIAKVMPDALPHACCACIKIIGVLPTIIIRTILGFGLFLALGFVCFPITSNLLRIAYLAYDFLYYLQADGISSLLLLLPKQFGYTVLYIVSYVVVLTLVAKVSLHALQITIQQLVGILINIVQCTKKVDGNILFHRLEMYIELLLYFRISFCVMGLLFVQLVHRIANFQPTAIQLS